jgi:hypothetical protein
VGRAFKCCIITQVATAHLSRVLFHLACAMLTAAVKSVLMRFVKFPNKDHGKLSMKLTGSVAS